MTGSYRMPLYAIAIFIGALLLFQIQPIMAKMILPWFGGAASVWITCMMFYQTGLLGGYLYAHVISLRLGPKQQALLHILLLAASLALLPVMPDARWKPLGTEEPILHIIVLLSATVGLPYFLLSATSPLLQAWYSRRFQAALPYRLFALSNLASLAGLLAYPFVIEPRLTLSEQSLLWSSSYGTFVILCIVTAVHAMRAGRLQTTPADSATAHDGYPAVRTRAIWFALACSSTLLLMAGTHHLTQNVTSIPFLWILPLSLYLFSFVLCFDFQGVYRRKPYLWLLTAALGVMAYGLAVWTETGLSLRIVIPAYAFGMFVCFMFFHGELAKSKPHPDYLTAYYLMISLGGALGGMLMGIVSPLTISGYYEMPIVLLLSSLIVFAVHRNAGRLPQVVSMVLIIGILVAAGSYLNFYFKYAYVMARNFYGDLVVSVSDRDTEYEYRSLLHGIVIHGVQYTAPELRRAPVSYFAPYSGIGLAFSHLRQTPSPLRVGIVGLGAGALAAYAEPGDAFRFYEINPLVVELAKREFTYLSDAPASIAIEIGDGRLSLEREPDQNFDLLVFDAFSGDAIPAHLLTTQAMELYLRHLKPGGILALNISNTYIDLAPIAEQLGRTFGRQVTFIPSAGSDEYQIYYAAWILLSAQPLDDPDIVEASQPLQTRSDIRVWTDDYSNLFQVLR